MRLIDVSNIAAGHPFRGKIPESKGTGIYAVQMKDASAANGIEWDRCAETAISSKRQPDWLNSGDILFAARGVHNYSVLVGEIPENFRAVASPHFYRLRCTTQKILPEYLAWLLNQAPIQRYFQREAEGSVTKSIRRNVLENTSIAIPSLERQHSIVRLAETVRKEQQLLSHLIRTGEDMMSAIAKDLLTGSK